MKQNLRLAKTGAEDCRERIRFVSPAPTVSIVVPTFRELDRKHGESKLNLREQRLSIQHLFRLYVFRYPELFRFATFGAVGVSGMAVDLVSLSALFPLTGLAVGRALAIWFAMTWNFAWNRRITFIEPAGSDPLGEYVRFCSACLVGAGISWGTSMGLVATTQTFTNQPLAAATMGTGVAAVVNYALCRLWVFGKRKPAAKPSIVPHPSTVSESFEPMVINGRAA